MTEPRREPNPAGIVPALVAFQSALPRIGRASQAQYGKYADLSDVAAIVLPRLAQVGICYTAQLKQHGDDRWVLVAELRHVSGDTIGAEWPIPLSINAQTMGSAITYGRRYCLLALCGCHPEGEDDEGQATAGKEHAKLAKATVATAKKATRSRTTRDQPDEWQDLPPVTHTPPPGEKPRHTASEPRSDEQSVKMFTMLGQLGIAGPDRGRELLRRLAGRETLESSKDLTRAEATAVIDALEDITRQDNPKAAVEAILGEWL